MLQKLWGHAETFQINDGSWTWDNYVLQNKHCCWVVFSSFKSFSAHFLRRVCFAGKNNKSCMMQATCLFLMGQKIWGTFVCKKSLPGRLVVTAQICEFGNLGCVPEKLTGCLRDLEEVNGLATSWPLGWAKPACLYFEEGGGVFCWVLLLWLCFYISDFPLRSHTVGAACLSLPLQPDARGTPRTGSPVPVSARTWGKQDHTKMQRKRHCSVSEAGYRGAWDVTEVFVSP